MFWSQGGKVSQCLWLRWGPAASYTEDVFFRELLETGILIIFLVSIKNEYRSVGRSRRKGKPGAHLQKEGTGLI